MSRPMSAAVSGRKYRGRTALGYEARRRGQRRWRLEHEAVDEWLRALNPENVLDVPVGTGRFFPIYRRLKIRRRVIGLDISGTMLDIARMHSDHGGITLDLGDALDLQGRFASQQFDAVVCVRLLHLVNKQEAASILAEICRVAHQQVILTVRLAPRYVENPSSTTMPARWFRARVSALGWRVAEERRLSRQGWTIMRLERAR